MSEVVPKLFTRRTLAVAIGLVLLFTLVLVLKGRPAWCKYGLALWSDANTHCTSQQLLDPYTMSHFLHGVIFFWLLWPFAARVALQWRLIAAMTLEIGWELFENSHWVIERYRQNTASLDYSGDSILNSLSDVGAATVGFAFAARYSWKASVAVFVAFELVQLYLARDNLTLNVIMLLYPLEAIKQWQLGG
jgi:hypothetical protein